MTSFKDAASGVIWSLVDLLAARTINLITLLILSRKLEAEDFSIFSMLAVFVGLSSVVVDFGIRDYLIRKREILDTDLRSATLAAFSISAFCFFACLFFSKFVANYYSTPQLDLYVNLIALTLFSNALTVVPSAILIKSMNFRKLFSIKFPSILISNFVAIILAFSGYATLTLVLPVVLQSFLIMFRYMQIFRSYRYLAPVSLSHIFAIYRNSFFYFLNGMTGVLFQNMYLIFIPRFMSSEQSGVYYFAEKLKDAFTGLFVTSLQNVTYSQSVRNLTVENAETSFLLTAYRVITPVLGTVTAFMFFGLVDDLSKIFGERWSETFGILKWMMVAAYFYPIHVIGLNALKAQLNQLNFFLFSSAKRFVTITVFLITLPLGVEFIVLGQLISSLITLFFQLVLMRYLIHIPLISSLVIVSLNICVPFSLLFLFNFYLPTQGILSVIFNFFACFGYFCIHTYAIKAQRVLFFKLVFALRSSILRFFGSGN